MNNEVSKIEIAKALKSVNSISTNDQIEKVINIFSSTEEDKVYFINAINGLSEEDEFALLTKLMKTSTCIIGLEQRPIVPGNYIIPDFLVTFKPCCTINSRLNESFNEYNCLVEVKSTKKNKFKIGGNRLKKLRNTADKYELPLIIAIRFVGFREHAFWAFIEDDRTKTSINTDVDACIKGVRHVLWDEYSILLNPSLTIIAEYHSNSQRKTVSHKTYGRQEKLTLATKNKTVLIEEENIQFLYSIFLECFNLEVKAEEKVDSNITLQYLQPSIPTMLLSDIVYRKLQMKMVAYATMPQKF